jgi:hypothetical protein
MREMIELCQQLIQDNFMQQVRISRSSLDDLSQSRAPREDCQLDPRRSGRGDVPDPEERALPQTEVLPFCPVAHFLS